MKAKLEHNCEFCGTGTNYKDNDHYYCIDCYVKLRNSAIDYRELEPERNKFTDYLEEQRAKLKGNK